MNNNGRVNIASPKTKDLFQMYDKIPVNQCITFRNPTEGLWDNTKLSSAFFGQPNITTIQKGIQQGVYILSKNKYEIGMQDGDTLKIIMRSIFLQNAMNSPGDLETQISTLNNMVWNYCIPQVYGEAKGYHKYLSDASTMYRPLPPPIFSSTSDKQLELKPWF
jgi:hypothetical protein